MNKKVKVMILRTAGTNCDAETAFAFRSCGAHVVDLVHVNRLLQGAADLSNYHILTIPGGFTYGDDIESGRILANELRLKLDQRINCFIKEGKLILGICNGFQVLVKAGILPGVSGTQEKDSSLLSQQATLVGNDSGKFEDRWIYLKMSGKSVWTKGIKDIVHFPVAHAEGKFVSKNSSLLRRMKQNGQVAFRYCTKEGQKPNYPENPNGSVDDIAGITDPSGRILGLMPHPERHFLLSQHPSWTRLKRVSRYGDGALIFENGVQYIKEHLL